MVYVPISTTDDAFESPSEMTAKPQVGALFGAVTDFQNTLATLPSSVWAEHVLERSDTLDNPGKFLSHDEIGKSYSNIASAYPKGGYETTVSARSELKGRNDLNRTILDSMKPGLLNNVGKATGFLLGNFVSPVNWAAGFGADMAASRAAQSFLPKLLEKGGLKYTMAKAGLGFTEGGVAITPLALSTQEYYKSINEPISAWNAVGTIAMGGALGGAIRGVIGFRMPIRTGDDEIIIAAAKAQMGSGKQVDIGLLAQNGLYQADRVDNATIPELNASREIINNRIVENKADIEAEQLKFNELTKDKPGVATREIKPSDAHSLDGRKLVDDAIAIQHIPESFRTPEQNEILKRLPDTDEIQAALTLKGLPDRELTNSQKTFLDRFDNGDEANIVKDRIKLHEEQIEKINEILDKKKPLLKEDEIKFLDEAKLGIKDRIDTAKIRYKQLREIETEPKRIAESRRKLLELRAKDRAFNEMNKDIDAHLELKNNAPKPVSKDALKAVYEKQQSWESNSTSNLSDYSKAQREALKASQLNEDEIAKDDLDTLQSMDLEPEESDVLASVKETNKEMDTVNKSLDKIRKCLVGNAGE